jgi:hypothetical protein
MPGTTSALFRECLFLGPRTSFSIPLRAAAYRHPGIGFAPIGRQTWSLSQVSIIPKKWRRVNLFSWKTQQYS